MEANSTIEDGDQGHFWNSNVFDRFRSDLLQPSMKLETVLRFFKCHCSALIMCKVVLNVYQVGFLALRNHQSFDSNFTISNRAGVHRSFGQRHISSPGVVPVWLVSRRIGRFNCMLVSITFCATRGRPLPNWIERSVRESRTSFMSCHQVACSDAGSIPLLKTGKVTVVCDSSERSAGRGFENCVAVVSSGRPDVNNRMFVVILQRKYTSVQITNPP